MSSPRSDVDDVDIFAGGMSERLVPGSMVGPTFACILGRQFRKLKVGDRFWYENGNSITGFSLGLYDMTLYLLSDITYPDSLPLV